MGRREARTHPDLQKLVKDWTVVWRGGRKGGTDDGGNKGGMEGRRRGGLYGGEKVNGGKGVVGRDLMEGGSGGRNGRKECNGRKGGKKEERGSK